MRKPESFLSLFSSSKGPAAQILGYTPLMLVEQVLMNSGACFENGFYLLRFHVLKSIDHRSLCLHMQHVRENLQQTSFCSNTKPRAPSDRHTHRHTAYDSTTQNKSSYLLVPCSILQKGTTEPISLAAEAVKWLQTRW